MSVILELSVPPDDFGIGRVLSLSGDESVLLEPIVPIGGEVVPFVRVRGVCPEAFEAAVRPNPRVDTVEWFGTGEGEHLFALDWRIDDALFDAIDAADGHVLEAGGGTETWQFRLRFPDPAAVSDFDARLGGASIPFDVTAVYNQTRPSVQPWYGLTDPQREALVAAVEAGYFAIPRGVTTSVLAEDFGISDQAFIERLRRAVSTLTRNTLMDEMAE